MCAVECGTNLLDLLDHPSREETPRNTNFTQNPKYYMMVDLVHVTLDTRPSHLFHAKLEWSMDEAIKFILNTHKYFHTI